VDTNEHPCVAVKELKRVPGCKNDSEFREIAEAEASALEKIRELKHQHLIRAIAYYTQGKKHYVMFPWARHGNLRDFWKKDPPLLNRTYLKWCFTQLAGLSNAIEKLHQSDSERSMRHGDLKPENILCFDDATKPGDGTHVSCILVIADVGLAKGHDKMTEMRTKATRTNSGTIMYEPPETELDPTAPRSRRYDIWSIGCIYVEFIIWLLYGAKQLAYFREDLSEIGVNTRFYIVENKTARLNGVVQKWVDWIQKDPRCPEDTAIRRLIEIVVTRLLVTDVSRSLSKPSRSYSVLHEANVKSGLGFAPTNPSIVRTSTNTSASGSNNDSPPLTTRASAKEMDSAMQEIFNDANNGNIEWMVYSADSPQGARQFGDRLDPTGAHGTVRRDSKDPEVRSLSPRQTANC
jgi:serine/threonine protein kinase